MLMRLLRNNGLDLPSCDGPVIVLDDSYEPDADIKDFLVSQFKEIKENHHFALYITES